MGWNEDIDWTSADTLRLLPTHVVMADLDAAIKERYEARLFTDSVNSYYYSDSDKLNVNSVECLGSSNSLLKLLVFLIPYYANHTIADASGKFDDSNIADIPWTLADMEDEIGIECPWETTTYSTNLTLLSSEVVFWCYKAINLMKWTHNDGSFAASNYTYKYDSNGHWLASSWKTMSNYSKSITFGMTTPQWPDTRRQSLKAAITYARVPSYYTPTLPTAIDGYVKRNTGITYDTTAYSTPAIDTWDDESGTVPVPSDGSKIKYFGSVSNPDSPRTVSSWYYFDYGDVFKIETLPPGGSPPYTEATGWKLERAYDIFKFDGNFSYIET